ncbi:MAG: DUF4430 domain-containing protein [Patescibacteria group bacterium]|nr:DUF4430 domain-containing protein [Patescibacteria group bacterium]
MKRRIILLLLVATLVFSFAPAKADYSASIVYLQSQNQNSWITQALAANGYSNPDISYIDAGTADLMTAAKNILALAAVASQDSDAIVALANTVENNFNNGQLGSPELLNDDSWGLMALAAADRRSNIGEIKNFILSQQNSDGGWSWSVEINDSDSNDTAAAIMALLDAGLAPTSAPLQASLVYLQDLQNDDGGFPYQAGSQSDGASTAWVVAALNKANISPLTWQKNSADPVVFLNSLLQPNGSFLWLPSDSNGSAMVTAYALVALSGKYYPLNYLSLSEESNTPLPLGQKIRIEGPDNSLCLTQGLSAVTVLDILAAAAQICGYTYQIENSDYGPYVSSIGGIDSQGSSGWQYFVNWQAGTVSADNYQLAADDEVLWAYGGYPFYPSRLTADKLQVEAGEIITVLTQYFDGSVWQSLVGVDIKAGSLNYQSDSAGQAEIAFASDGVYPLFVAGSDNYVRSEKLFASVGEGVSQSVDLLAYIEASDPGPQEGTVAFSLSQSSINFGSLRPGQSAESIVIVNNLGSLDIHLESSILGEDIFAENVRLDNQLWPAWQANLATAASNAVNVRLAVPSGFSLSGSKSGQLIFWATAR